MIYLASPYTHPEEHVMEVRYRTVTKVTSDLFQKGEYVFSPIAYLHHVARFGRLPTGWDFWKEYDRLMIGMCSRFMILTLPGWETSVGVSAELEIARELGREIEYMDHPLLEVVSFKDDGVVMGQGDVLKRMVFERTGIIAKDLKCPREKSGMTPCVARDGDLAVSVNGACIGCGIPVDELIEIEKKLTGRPPRPC